MSYLRIVALTATVAASAPCGVAAQNPSLRGEIEALHMAMTEAFKTEPASVAKFYTDDASILGGGGRYVGREQINQYWSQTPPGSQWTLEVLEVGGDSLTPWVRGRSTLQGQSGRRMETDYIGILRRQPDGSLKFYVDMYVAASPGMARRIPGAKP